jgi:hypothetical protein
VKKSTITTCVLMFSASFLLLASAYDAMPAELPMFRNPIAGAVTIAPKSVFTVFRVPVMNLTHGLMAAVMLSHATDFEDERRSSYAALFTTLLFAIAVKSDFEALEISGLAGAFGRWATAGTMVSVVGGLLLAFVRGRRVPAPWPELRLPTRHKFLLAGLCVSYLAVIMASVIVSYRH